MGNSGSDLFSYTRQTLATITIMKKFLARSILYLFTIMVKVLAGLRSVRPRHGRRPTIILTGQFASPRWAAAHLLPIAQSGAFGRIWVVSDHKEIECDAITWVEPPFLLTKIVGRTIARLLTFMAFTLRYRPDWIAGFHLLFNGMLAILLAMLLRRRCMYFCTGGPAEVMDGGLQSENRLFGSLKTKSTRIEKQLIQITHFSDAIVFMGTQARDYYASQGYTQIALVNPGGIETAEVRQSPYRQRSIDVIFVGRLAAIKDIPLFLRTIASARETYPEIKAVIVGDGDERTALEAESNRLGLSANVTFAGYQSNVQDWLNDSKVLMLTSKSEGLSLAVMEAIASGVPVIAPAVGDLRDAVVDDTTGYLVGSRSAGDFADRLLHIATNEDTFSRLSANAIDWSERFSTAASAQRWQDFVTRSDSEGQNICVG